MITIRIISTQKFRGFALTTPVWSSNEKNTRFKGQNTLMLVTT